MKTLLWLVILFGLMPSAFAEKPLILITSFDGFANATVNHSNLVSARLAVLLSNRFDVSECLLPTVYDASFERASECLRTLPKKPDLIISMGEGSPCQNVELETLVRNRDHAGMQDNAGVSRLNHTILPHEAPIKQFFFFNDQTPNLLSQIKEIKFDQDAGSFVCNNLGFQMTTYLENYSAPRIPYAFIHVPPHQCKNGLGVSGSAQAISKLLLSLNLY